LGVGVNNEGSDPGGLSGTPQSPADLAEGLTTTKVFEVLLDALKEAYKELFDLGFKISGVQIIVLGWFAADKNPLEILKSSKYLAWGALAGVVVGFLAICFLYVTLARRAQAAAAELQRRGFEASLFQRYEVAPRMLQMGIAVQAVLMSGIFGSICARYA
jgi:hypothetical protein